MGPEVLSWSSFLFKAVLAALGDNSWSSGPINLGLSQAGLVQSGGPSLEERIWKALEEHRRDRSWPQLCSYNLRDPTQVTGFLDPPFPPGCGNWR